MARAAALLLIILGALPALLGRVAPDTAWLLHVAGRMLDGARPYVDVVEVNPPLVMWLDLVPVGLGRVLHLPEATVFTVLVVLLALASAAASARLLRTMFPDRPTLRQGLALAALFILLPLSREDFGQREHLFLALALPYVLLAGLRAEGRPVGRAEAAAVGVAAGLGIALKPYFVLLWAAVEVGLLVRNRLRTPRLRPESIAVVVVGLLYLGAVLRWTPEYFRVVQSMGGPYYDFLSNTLWRTALLGDGAILPIVALLAVLALRRDGTATALWSIVAWAMAGLWLAAVLQHKGWRYHFYPAFALAIWLLVLAYLDAARPLRGRVQRVYAALSFAAVVTVGVVTLSACLFQTFTPRDPRWDVDPDLHRLLPVVREHAAGGSMGMLSWGIASAYPLATYAGVSSASRFPSLWFLGAIYWRAVRSDAPIRFHTRQEMGDLERYVNDAVVADLAKGRPGVLAVLRPEPDRREWGLRRLDLLRYFERDPRFAALFRRYAFLEQIGEYWVFVRLPEGAPPAPAWERPESRGDRPDPGLAGGTKPLDWRQMLAGVAFLAVLGVGLYRERRIEFG